MNISFVPEPSAFASSSFESRQSRELAGIRVVSVGLVVVASRRWAEGATG